METGMDQAAAVGDLAARLLAKAPDWVAIEASGLADVISHAGWLGLAGLGMAAGAAACQVPVGETALARFATNTPALSGIATLALASGHVAGGRFTGTTASAPWGRLAGRVLCLAGDDLILVDAAGAAVRHAANLAGDARDTLAFNAATILVRLPGMAAPVFAGAALLRAAQMAGALDAALTLSLTHANTREQFGRPLGKFQAVQQALALLAEEAAACRCAVLAAAAALDAGSGDFEVAAARLRACMAADTGAAIAHQVHGAIGITQDYALQHATRRLAAWRGEFGHDRHWAERLGRSAAAAGPARLWDDLTARGDRLASGECRPA